MKSLSVKDFECPRAQGTIEYLVILAIVVIIALVVVGLMTGFLSPSMQVSELTSQIGVSTQSIALTEGIASIDGNAVLTLQNNCGETITLDSITVNGTPHGQGAQMPNGDKKSFTLTGIESCTGNQKAYSVSFGYTTQYMLEKAQDLGQVILECEETVVAAQLTQTGTGGPTCGNAILEGTENCDSNTQACTAAGGYPGNQTCLPDCSGYGACVSTLTCGDTIINGSEACDSDTRACTIGGYNGTQTCRTDCTDYNTCIATESCGDNNTNGTETCDGTSLNGQTCNTQGYQAGTLACAPGCAAYNTSGCYNILTLTSTDTGTYKDSETLAANITGYSPTTKSYWYKWYKGNDLNATNLITNGLVSYWPLNNNTNDYYGTNNGANNSATQIAGKIGGAYNFNGSSNWISLTSSPFTLQNFTVSAWINSDSFAGSKAVFATTNTAAYCGYEMMPLSAGKMGFRTVGTAGQTIDGVESGLLATGTWYHLVGTKDGSALRLYVNGQLVGEDSSVSGVTYTGCSGGDTMYPQIGRVATTGGNVTYYDGKIDEVLFFNRALTATEVGQLYLGGVYDGNKMGSTRTAQGEQWKVGVRDNNGAGWGTDYNSSPATITAFSCGDSINDDRDYRSYRTQQFGSVGCWFKDNINVGEMKTYAYGTAQNNDLAIEKYCFGNVEANCDQNGGLYEWAEALQIGSYYRNHVSVYNGNFSATVQGICPSGWHIPSDDEYHALTLHFRDLNNAGGSCNQYRYTPCGSAIECYNAGNYFLNPAYFDGKYAGYCLTYTNPAQCGTGIMWFSTYEYNYDSTFFLSFDASLNGGVNRGGHCSPWKQISTSIRCKKY